MTAALTVTSMSKSFAGPRVLNDVSLSIEPGEIRALVGENGSGKSTLIKILAGFHLPDEGSAEVDGQPLPLGNGASSETLGLRFVHQDLGLVNNLDAVDNMALGVGYPSFRGGIRWRQERKRARKALADLGYHFDVRRTVDRLAMSERTALAVARAMGPRQAQPKVLVLDEPTANLPAAEAERLFQLAKRVADSGVAVMFVSHHFDEVFGLAHSVTVLRDGQHVITRPVAGLTEDGLIELVIGRQLEQVHHDAKAAERKAIVLEVGGLECGVLNDVDLAVHAGEIVGVAGITGSGRDEVARALFGGLERSGEVKINGAVVPPLRPDRAMAMGMGLVPAERHANAAFMASTLRENVTVVRPGTYWRGGILRKSAERSDVAKWLERLDVRPREPEFTMADLSGGNQQKVVLARWLRLEPKVLVLDEPTQGVDVGAKSDIHKLVDEAAAQGTAVLVASTDHEELVRLCHRVLVFRRGRIADEIFGGRMDHDVITAATIGRDQAGAA
ncbi:MAG TPA: sugar ABC transporter ATP-binding protein [Streptosporangiaceae bacterium]|nr:sugar ABC transporter ATP-binding protein [Streptosporangiaceae bacterium]